MNAEVLTSSGMHALKLEGSWTIERAYELKELLMEALTGGHDVLVDLGGVVEVDLSCLQLLCSAHRSFLKRNKQFALHDNKPEVLKEAVRNAGYARTLGCHQDCCGNCLWIGGWES